MDRMTVSQVAQDVDRAANYVEERREEAVDALRNAPGGPATDEPYQR